MKSRMGDSKAPLLREEGTSLRLVCSEYFMTPCVGPPCSNRLREAFVLQTYTHFREAGSSMRAASPQQVSGRMSREQGQVPSEPGE